MGRDGTNKKQIVKEQLRPPEGAGLQMGGTGVGEVGKSVGGFPPKLAQDLHRIP